MQEGSAPVSVERAYAELLASTREKVERWEPVSFVIGREVWEARGMSDGRWVVSSPTADSVIPKAQLLEYLAGARVCLP